MDILKHWYRANLTALGLALIPLTGLFWLVSNLNRILKSKKQTPFSVPVLVVGNVSVGGTGKTPFIHWICSELAKHEIKVGIVSRGYGANINTFPVQLPDNARAEVYGDEPTLLSKLTKVPVVISPDRTQAVNYLLSQNEVDLIVSDDGMQHYSTHRDIEICMIDGQRALGNQWLLPSGPLRELTSRINKCDFVVAKGQVPELLPKGIKIDGVLKLNADLPINPQDGSSLQPGITVYGVSGIGNPEQFFNQLETQGFIVIPKPFPDHHLFTQADVQGWKSHPVVMTQKDFVKCETLGLSNIFVTKVHPSLEERTSSVVLKRIKQEINKS